MRCGLVMRSDERRNIEMLGNRAIFGLRRGKVVFLYDLLDLSARRSQHAVHPDDRTVASLRHVARRTPTNGGLLQPGVILCEIDASHAFISV